MVAETDAARLKEIQLFEFKSQPPEESKIDAMKGKFNDLVDDIDIEEDPYYLKYYRSFHNHDLDTHLVD